MNKANDSTRALDSFTLGYCTNMHPGDSWDEIFSNLKQYIPDIKKQVSPNEAFGIGLRLSQASAESLKQSTHMVAFKNWLASENCFVFTLNGFVHGGFYHQGMKHDVYRPYWHSEARYQYTLDLIHLLSAICKSGDERGISVSPLGYKFDFAIDHNDIKYRGAEHLASLALTLSDIENATGVYIHLDIEPEPDCLIETIDEFVAYFTDYILPIGTKKLMEELQISEPEAIDKLRRYITLCLDVCHLAVNFESVDDALSKIAAHQLKIGKVQLSSALNIELNDSNRQDVLSQLASFKEHIYLHQTRLQTKNELLKFTDLDKAIDYINTHQTSGLLRSHYHVPVFLSTFERLGSTQDILANCLRRLKTNAFTRHMEIETYTWSILPASMQLAAADAVVREINWVKDQLKIR